MTTPRARLAAALLLVPVLSCSGAPAPAPLPPDAAPPGISVERALAEVVASLSELEGTVEVRRASETAWEPAAIGATLRAGDRVRTGPGGFARVGLLDRGELELAEGSTLVIDASSTAPTTAGVGQTVVALEQGTARGTAVPAQGGAAPLVILGEDGARAEVAAETGDTPTRFRVTGGADRTTEIAVETGRATVVTGGGKAVVSEREAVGVARDRPPEVVRLLPFPESRLPGIDARFRWAPGLEIELGWMAVAGAASYRVEVARDMSFQALVHTGEAKTTRHAFSPPGEGMLVWRVAARDAKGRLGEFNFARRLFCETGPPQDLLVSPRDGTKLAYTKEDPRILFSWQSAGGVDSYRLLVGRGASPAQGTVLDQITAGQQIEIQALGEGTYTWGVYARSGGKETPIFLSPRKLTIRRTRGPRVDTGGLWGEGRP